MLFEFEADDLANLKPPAEWARYARRTASGVRISGDRTGYREIYVHCGASVGFIATSLGELLDHLAGRGDAVGLSTFGISSLLHHALIPLPYTVYRNIYLLAMGDVAEVRSVGGTLRIDLSNDYPWTTDRSANNRKASEETLLGMLTQATERQLATFGGEGFLMLSSGKDSSAVALSLAEAGLRGIPCITYSSGPEDSEPAVAAGICRRLGLQHEIVEMPSSREKVSDALMAFFRASAVPGTDLSQIPYIFATAGASPSQGAVIDGGGNDSYMGIPVTGHDLAKLRFRVRGRSAAIAMSHLLRVDSSLNYLTRSRAAATLPGRLLRIAESRVLFPAATDTTDWWYNESRATRHFDPLDLCGIIKERHAGPAGAMQKQRLAANALGLGSSLPWCDDNVADYYFNLPERFRYDRRSGTNKILLRRMLHRYLRYDAGAVGKHYFAFDGAAFIYRNRDFVRSEIDGCSLWDRKGLMILHRWLDDIVARPLLYHSLVTVFMVSGWHNHSRFLGRGRTDSIHGGGA